MSLKATMMSISLCLCVTLPRAPTSSKAPAKNTTGSKVPIMTTLTSKAPAKNTTGSKVPIMTTLTSKAPAVPTSSGTLTPICQAQITRNNLVSKLSPGGQKNVTQIALDVQYTTGAVAQQIWGFLGLIYGANVSQIAYSADGSKLAQLGSLLGNSNYTYGAGPLQDLCALQSNVNKLVASFLSANQPTVQAIVNGFVTGLKGMTGTVLTTVNYFDAPILKYLNKTENSTVMNALMAYQYIYGYL